MLHILYIDLYLATLIVSNIFVMASLGCCIYRVVPSESSGSFTSSFPFWMTFIYFSSLIVLARISSTMLNNSDESRYPSS